MKVLIIFIILFCPVKLSAKEIPKKVTLEEGKHLMRLALKSQNLLNGFDDPSSIELSGPFLNFPIFGAFDGFSGEYDVNAWTGEVWDTFECKIITSPELNAEQIKIKKRFLSTELKEYSRLQTLRPERVYDSEPCGSLE